MATKTNQEIDEYFINILMLSEAYLSREIPAKDALNRFINFILSNEDLLYETQKNEQTQK